MDQYARENWRKIRDHLESVGATDNHYYKRAKRIASGDSDLFDDRTAGCPDLPST